MESDYRLAVFIGRFQPFHNSHVEVVKQGLEIADKVLVIVGSSHAARSVKNPFSYEERRMMIQWSIQPATRLLIEPVRDYYYNTDFWTANVQAVIDKHTRHGDPVALIGSYKDASSYYLNLFPQWDLKLVNTGSFHGTQIRQEMWVAARNDHSFAMPDWEGKIPRPNMTNLHNIASVVPAGTYTVIDSFMKTSNYGTLAKEQIFLEDYKKKWEVAPFPPTFVTVDAVVTCAGHVLVVKRGGNPGKGLYALPGGFIKQEEHIQDAMIRELREETRISKQKLILESSIVGSKVFDHPERSLRGRTISHGYHIDLRDSELPEVRGADDADEAFWMPLWDVTKNETEFFEDHAHIINYFTGVGAQ